MNLSDATNAVWFKTRRENGKIVSVIHLCDGYPLAHVARRRLFAGGSVVYTCEACGAKVSLEILEMCPEMSDIDEAISRTGYRWRSLIAATDEYANMKL